MASNPSRIPSGDTDVSVPAPEQGVRAVLTAIRKSRYSEGITAWQELPARPAQWCEYPDAVHPGLLQTLKNRSYNRLYVHQAAAWDAVQRGENPVVVTPTASGKTLCYNLPVLHALMCAPERRALYLYPTKALAQDQYQELVSVTTGMQGSIRVGVYDGDTPPDARRLIREQAHIVLTNPDMLHTGMLPHHSRWNTFFRHLSFVVIDELHQYRGVFGSHFCNVLRRLKRICRFHGSTPRFIMSSATIANPQELAMRMIGEPVTLINCAGSPAGEKTFLFYNPPVVDSAGMIRRSYLDESVRWARLLLEAGIQTIVFTRSRRAVELILRELQKTFSEKPGSDAIYGYRGGYLPRERRAIESGLRDGRIRCVVATSALELGVDIGDMGAAVLAGYPGTIASTWQRAGRAGRRENRSIAILVASAAPLDQYIVRNPEYFFLQSAENGRINPDNLLIVLEHIRCAAFEMPFSADERYAGLNNTGDFQEYLEEEGVLRFSGDKWYYTGGDYPAQNVSLRSVSPDTIVITDMSSSKPEVIGNLDVFAAHLLLHPEAVYMHGGRQYLVESLDLENRRARIQPLETGYYTMPLEQTRVTVLAETLCSEHLCPVRFGELQVVGRVIGYKKLRFGTQELLGTGSVTLPERELITSGAWFSLSIETSDYAGTRTIQAIAAGLVGALTAVHSVSSVVLMSDPRDLGACVSSADNTWTAQIDHLGMLQLSGHATGCEDDVNLYIYDGYPGGIGLSESLFYNAENIVKRAAELVAACECRFGCPGCVGPVTSGEHSIKAAARTILRYLEKNVVIR